MIEIIYYYDKKERKQLKKIVALGTGDEQKSKLRKQGYIIGCFKILI